MFTRSRRFSRAGVQASLVILSLALVMGPLGGCARSTKPREKWWQLWRPKATETSKIYEADTVIPPAPDVLDPSGGGQSQSLGYDESTNALPPPPVVSDATEMPENEPVRQAPAGEISGLQTVHFDTDSDELSGEARQLLDQNATWLRANPQYEIQVEGHADARGTDEYNLNLGQRRAKSVIAYLVAQGVDANRLHAISYGEMRPIALGGGPEAWDQNRRVQFLVY